MSKTCKNRNANNKKQKSIRKTKRVSGGVSSPKKTQPKKLKKPKKPKKSKKLPPKKPKKPSSEPDCENTSDYFDSPSNFSSDDSDNEKFR
jgi:hypothetical protein